MPEKPPIVLTIAGFDPSSGAGVTADIKTIAAHGCDGVGCITALNVHSTDGVKRVVERLIPLADVVTPNVDEAAALTGLQVKDIDGMKASCANLHEKGASAIVITGGHLEKAIDLLSFTTERGIEQEIFKAERQRSNSTHGTGCAFATAMACHLALDRGLAEATLLAKTYVNAAISNGHPVGKGIGPVHHLYRMSQQRRAAGSGGEST